MLNNRPYILLIAVFASLTVFATDPDLEEPVEEISDFEIRENPVVDSTGVSEWLTIDLSPYSFLNQDVNRIELNGADWTRLAQAFADTENRGINIIHIGDSHIQADILGDRVRRLMQDKYGEYGRGLITPLRLAGTNQPRDYSVTSESHFISEKLICRDPILPRSFTGITLEPTEKTFDFTIRSRDSYERITLYYGGNTPEVTAVGCDGSNLIFSSSATPGKIEIDLPFPCEETRLELSSLGDTYIYGFKLDCDIVGVSYSSIGINGATFANYNSVENFGEKISSLSPDLLVISLGTNEAFGRFSDSDLYYEISSLVNGLASANPGSAILLVTPSECQRRVRRGRRGRRRTSYVNADNIVRVRNVILNFARENSIAVYDWHEAAGGDGSSAQWLKASLLGRDRVHYTSKGYDVAGQMLFNAIDDKIKMLNAKQ